jgi:hypothetical protein
MSVIKVNNITSRDGTTGPVIAGIATVSTTSHLVVPTGNTGQKVPLAPDPYINNLVLALPFNSESVFDDVSPRNQGTLKVKGNFASTTSSLPFGVTGVTTTSSGIVTFSKYYGTSCYFDGTGDAFNLSVPIEFGVGEAMTAECWVYKTAVDASGYTNVFSSTSQNVQLTIDGVGAGSIGFVYQGAVRLPTAGTAVTIGFWNHLAWVRDSEGNCAAYVNGILKTKSTTPSTLSFNIDVIGEYSNGGGYEMNGYMQDVRIYKGVAKYPFVGIATETQVFTPPTQIAL